jgi:hypothetical protein
VNPSEGSNRRDQPLAHQQHRLAMLQQFSVVSDVRAGRTEVNHRLRRWRDLTEMVHVGHDVVAQPLLPLRRAAEVDVFELRTHVREGGVRDLEAELLLRLRQAYRSVSGLLYVSSISGY